MAVATSAAVSVAVDATAISNSSSATPAIAITVTMDGADAISVVAAGVSKAVHVDRVAVVAIRVAIASRAADNAHRWRPSFRMVKRQAGSIHSAMVVSFDAPRTAISPNRAMPTFP